MAAGSGKRELLALSRAKHSIQALLVQNLVLALKENLVGVGSLRPVGGSGMLL